VEPEHCHNVLNDLVFIDPHADLEQVGCNDAVVMFRNSPLARGPSEFLRGIAPLPGR
jgi:hypothetical protein